MPENKYVQIALIEVSGSENETTSGLLACMRKKAGELGAQMVINTTITEREDRRGNLLIDARHLTDKDPTTTTSDATFRSPVMRGVAICKR